MEHQLTTATPRDDGVEGPSGGVTGLHPKDILLPTVLLLEPDRKMAALQVQTESKSRLGLFGITESQMCRV